MFSDKAQVAIDLAKDLAHAASSPELTLAAVLAATCSRKEAALLLTDCLALSKDQLERQCPEFPPPVPCPGKLVLNEGVRILLALAKDLAAEVQDRKQPGFIDLRHLVAALAATPQVCDLLHARPISRDRAIELEA